MTSVSAVIAFVLAAVACVLLFADPFELVSFFIKLLLEVECAIWYQTGTDDVLPLDNGLHQTFDFVVVGAGTAGCVIASRLSENRNWTVLLIEAGPGESALMDVPAFALAMQRSSTINWQYQTEPSAEGAFCASMVDGRCQWPRGKVMGGSSVLNFMIYTRGHPTDYDRWAAYGNEGWNYTEVEHYFNRIENMQVPDEPRHNSQGLLTVSLPQYQTELARKFLRSANETGLPPVSYNSHFVAGAGRLQSTTDRGLRFSSNRAYIMPFRDRQNLHTRTRSIVTKVIIDPSTKRATGVELFVNGKTEQIFASKEVILSAGAIASPQLLMLSGIGDANHLREHSIEPIVNNSNVGTNLMDHYSPEMFHIATNETANFIQEFLYPSTWYDYLIRGQGIMGTAGGCESVAFLSDQPNGEYPDIEMLEISAGLHVTRDSEAVVGLQPEIYYNNYQKLRELKRDIFALLVFPLRPKSRGSIRLRDADPLQHPIIDANYYSHPYDMAVTLKGIRRMLELLETPTMRSMNATLADTTVPACRHLVYASDAYWMCQARHLTYSVYHYSGTCRMGGDPTRSVVDSRLRVHGVKGLRVADASIMPEIVSGHPNSAVFMIGEKAADMVAMDWMGKSSSCDVY